MTMESVFEPFYCRTPSVTSVVQLYHDVCDLPDAELVEWRRRKTHTGLADDSSASSGLSAAPWMMESENVMAAVMAHDSATHFLNQENPVDRLAGAECSFTDSSLAYRN
jgi:hypothetical protein